MPRFTTPGESSHPGIEKLEARLSAAFVAQVRAIDGPLADIVQGHLDQGYSLSTVQAMLRDANAVVAAARGERA